MAWIVSVTTFFITVSVMAALVYALTAKEAGIAKRLSHLRDTSIPVERERFANKQKQRARGALVSLGRLLPAAAERRAAGAQLSMIRAGYRGADARAVIRGVKVILPVLLLAIVVLTGAYRFDPVSILLLAAAAGVLTGQETLGVNSTHHQAIGTVAQELRVVHPELSDELQIVNLEMRVGKTRIDALRELARRTNLDDIRTLVAMLIQTERFGTSIAQSLRVHSDELRTKRRQRAEERSAKTSVKMVAPLVLFIFPALIVVVLGPAIIALVRQLGPAFR